MKSKMEYIKYLIMKVNDRYEDDDARQALFFVIKEIGEYDIIREPCCRSYSRRLDLSPNDFALAYSIDFSDFFQDLPLDESHLSIGIFELVYDSY